MLTIITGTPGNGKTAHALDLLWFDKSTIWYGLEKYVDGVAELKLEHFEFPDVKTLKLPSYQPLAQVDSDEYAVWLPDNAKYSEFVEARATAKSSWDLWFLWATPNSVLVVDEAQRYVRPRPSGAPVPLAIQMIEYHRHFGIHIVFVTQKERLLHSNVRMLAGQHIHLTDGWRGRHRFEWPECKDSDSKTEKKLSAHTSYKLPTHVFPFYKSTVQHLSTSHKKPFYMYAVYAAVLVLIGSIYFLFTTFSAKVAKKDPPKSVASGQIAPASGVPSVAASGVPESDVPASGVPDLGSASSVLAASTTAYLKQFQPVVPGRPETATAFDGLRKIVSMPLVSGCLQSATDCKCYTQQGTRIFDMTRESCVAYLSVGSHFNPYRQMSDAPVRPSMPVPDDQDAHMQMDAPTRINKPSDRTRGLSVAM